MFPQIIDSLTIDNTHHILALDNSSVLTALELSLTDLESIPVIDAELAWQRVLQNLKPGALMRLHLHSEPTAHDKNDHARKSAVENLGFVQNRLFVTFETRGGEWREMIGFLKRGRLANPFEERARELRASFDLSPLKNIGVALKLMAEAEFKRWLMPNVITSHIMKRSSSLDFGSHLTGIVRLTHLGVTPISPETLAVLKDQLPLPFKMKTSVQRVPRERAESFLRRKSSQVKAGSDQIAAVKFEEAQSALTDVALMGLNLFEFEMLIEFERRDERALREDMGSCVQVLKTLGDFAIETFGCFPSFIAAQVGQAQHVSLLKTEQVLPCFLPVWTFGESRSFQALTSKRALALLRRDESLFYFDPFNPKYDNYSVCIFGKSGRGKSVLTNLLTRSLLHDEQVRIIKVDVGGSHSKETELLGGVERKLSLREPSGLNPFSVFREFPHSEDVCNIIASFLGVLILEEGEHSLTKAMKGELEQAVLQYSLLRPLTPSVDDCLSRVESIPRRALIERW